MGRSGKRAVELLLAIHRFAQGSGSSVHLARDAERQLEQQRRSRFGARQLDQVGRASRVCSNLGRHRHSSITWSPSARRAQQVGHGRQVGGASNGVAATSPGALAERFLSSGAK